jgi:cobalt-zinc-cadmium efflux system outer membrane protein
MRIGCLLNLGYVALLLALLTPLRARANWTLDAALARADEASPNVRTAQQRVAIAEAHRTFASVPVVGNPVLGVRAMVGVPDERAATYAVFLGLPFDWSGRQGLRAQEADALIETSEAELQATRNDVRLQVTRAFIDTAVAGDLRAIAEQRLAVAQQLSERTTSMAQAGAATRLDVALVEVELGEAAAALANAERNEFDAKDALRALLDLPTSDAMQVTMPSLDQASGEVAAWTEEALRNRAEPRSFAASARRFRLSESRLFAESVDPLLVGLEWEAQGNSQTAQTLGVSLGTTLPLLNTAQGERAVALEESALMRVSEGIAQRGVEREVFRASRQLDRARAELAALESQALPAMERAQSAMSELLTQGDVEFFRLVSVQRQLFETRAQRVNAMRVAFQALADLQHAIGTLGAP